MENFLLHNMLRYLIKLLVRINNIGKRITADDIEPSRVCKITRLIFPTRLGKEDNVAFSAFPAHQANLS